MTGIIATNRARAQAYRQAVELVDTIEEEFFFGGVNNERAAVLEDELFRAQLREETAGKLLCPVGDPDGHMMGYCACHNCPTCGLWYNADVEEFRCTCS